MSFDFSKFNNQVDLESIKKDINEVKDNSQKKEYEKVPFDTYEVEIAKLELVETKSAPARPMLTIWFRIIEGEYKGQLLFYNQQMYTASGDYAALFTRFCNEMLNSLDTGIPVIFEDYQQYAELIQEIATEIEGQYEYAVEYSQNNKGYDQYKIVDVFTL